MLIMVERFILNKQRTMYFKNKFLFVDKYIIVYFTNIIYCWNTFQIVKTFHTNQNFSNSRQKTVVNVFEKQDFIL